jgi:hypothetical protein
MTVIVDASCSTVKGLSYRSVLPAGSIARTVNV